MKTVKLGELIEISDLRNTDNKLTLDNVRGVSIEKKFIPTKANMDGVPLHNYKVVKPSWFCYVTVTSRNGGKISLAYQNMGEDIIVSSSYEVFYVKDKNKLLPEYLYMLFNRSEFDRYSRFNSWGSARETFDFSELCLVEIPLPDLETQKQIVASYNGLKNVIDDNMTLVEPLEKLCHAYIVDLKKKYPSVALGEYIKYVREKNTDQQITLEQGINISKVFITPQRSNADLSSRVIVRQGQFAYCTQLNNENVAIAYREGPDCVVSPVYDVFEITQKDKLLPEYLFIWLRRPEFGRFVYWASVGSAYEFMQQENVVRTKIPLPPIELQKTIATIFNCAQEAKKIANEAKEELKKLCPALVQFASKSA